MRPILQNHLPHVYRYALRLTRDAHAAEDLTQEAFVRAWQRVDEMTDERLTRIWLLRVTANLWRDDRRRATTRMNHLPTLRLAAEGTSFPEPDATAVVTEQTHDAMQLLDQLPERQRDVLYLTACEQLRPSEIANVLDISPRAVIASLSLARKKVRSLLDAHPAAEVRS